jgi:hypothetical protein
MNASSILIPFESDAKIARAITESSGPTANVTIEVS